MPIALPVLRRLRCSAAAAAVLTALAGCATPETLTPTRFGIGACSIGKTSDGAERSDRDAAKVPEPRNVIACWDLK